MCPIMFKILDPPNLDARSALDSCPGRIVICVHVSTDPWNEFGKAQSGSLVFVRIRFKGDRFSEDSISTQCSSRRGKVGVSITASMRAQNSVE